MDMIVAVDQNWGIGKGNDLLFHIPEDMKFFRQMTLGKNVVCGKKTLLSFPGGKPLPNRRHFVLTRGELEENENLVKVSSIDDLFQKIGEIPTDDVMVIGGESVYRQLLPFCKRIYVTRIYDFAFYRCTSLSKIEISSAVKQARGISIIVPTW
jgi:dihydrofolate reductase